MGMFDFLDIQPKSKRGYRRIEEYFFMLPPIGHPFEKLWMAVPRDMEGFNLLHIKFSDALQLKLNGRRELSELTDQEKSILKFISLWWTFQKALAEEPERLQEYLGVDFRLEVNEFGQVPEDMFLPVEAQLLASSDDTIAEDRKRIYRNKIALRKAMREICRGAMKNMMDCPKCLYPITKLYHLQIGVYDIKKEEIDEMIKFSLLDLPPFVGDILERDVQVRIKQFIN